MIYKEDGVWYREDDEGNETKLKLPMKWDICGNCRGDGSHMTESIRSVAYTTEQFDQEFPTDEEKDLYFNGGYDVRCQDCDGTGKVKVIVHELLSDELRKEFDDFWEDEREHQAEYEAEMRFGC